MPTLEEIIKAIPSFSAEEQERIADAIKASRSLGGARKGGVSLRSDMKDDTLLILNAICTDLKKHGLDNTSVDMAAQFSNYATFVKQATVIGEFVRSHGLNVGQRRKLVAMMAMILRQDLVKLNLPVSVRLMMAHGHRMQACFEREFPGYAAGGFISLIVGSKEQVK